MELTYNLVDGGRGIWCARCGKTSYNEHDVHERYCGHCRSWHASAGPAAGVAQPALPIWTIYERPTDYPAGFIARAFDMRTAQPIANEAPETGDTLDEVRRKVQARSRYVLDCVPRDPGDAASVVESWL
ncbi:MAG: hypothetical protein ACXWVD_00430 [Telluria sp.]